MATDERDPVMEAVEQVRRLVHDNDREIERMQGEDLERHVAPVLATITAELTRLRAQVAEMEAEVSDDDIRAWVKRHGLDIGTYLHEARDAFEDARSFRPNIDAGGTTDAK